MKFNLLIFLLCSIYIAQAQTDKGIKPTDAPASIPAYLSTHYPNHSKASYYMDTENDSSYYAVDFQYQKRKYSLLFTLDGDLFETEIQIAVSNLPKPVYASIENKLSADFSSFNIIKIEEVDANGLLMYELEIKGIKNKKRVFNEYYFDRTGSFIKMEVIELKTIPTLF